MFVGCASNKNIKHIETHFVILFVVLDAKCEIWIRLILYECEKKKI
jgi:hypothetical protein